MSVRRPTIPLAVSCLLLSVGAGTAQEVDGEPPVPTVAVMDFTGFSLVPGEDPAAVGSGLATMISTELANRPDVRVVDRQRVRELVETRQLAASGRMEEADAIRLGQLLGAHYILVGNVALEPERARIDLRLLDVGTGAVERATRRQGSRDDFLALVEAVADEFTDGLEVPARVAAVAVEPPVPAVLAYSRGLDYERRGLMERAESMYRRALELFPEHDAAAAALRRVSERGGSR